MSHLQSRKPHYLGQLFKAPTQQRRLLALLANQQAVLQDGQEATGHCLDLLEVAEDQAQVLLR
jgi:hypothetical protein